ncbi:MAG: helix-turn-helix domain-containing protein [Proteobacteria bacterium]|nr:helix-turn-helix domain-containing protein [Pseudomonadota bacterium]
MAADKLSVDIGLALKSRRERRGLSLRAVGSASGISASMISELERGAKSPTISTLAAIARALDIALPELLQSAAPSDKRIKVVRGGSRERTSDRKSGGQREDIGVELAGSKIEFLRYTVPAGKMAGPFPAHAKGTIEHLHVAAGGITTTFGEETETLAAGDSCACQADIAHYFDNRAGSSEAQLYIVVERP